MDGQRLTSGVIICAPPPVANFVQQVRTLHTGAESVHYVLPPHITVMYPFVSPGNDLHEPDTALLEQTSEHLRAVCQTIPPFSITLDRYATFPGRVLYMALADAGPVLALIKRLLQAFPEYPLYGGGFEAIVPHLTVTVVDSQDDLNTLARPEFPAFTFDVQELHFVYGEASLSRMWQKAAVIPLGENA